MFQTLFSLPLPFWLGLFAVGYFGWKAWGWRNAALGFPMLAVLGTATAWYVGDVFYNEYNDYLLETDRASILEAWWEFLLFICAFGWMAPRVHRFCNQKLLGQPSQLFAFIRRDGLNTPRFQDQIDATCFLLALIWLAMMAVAIYRTDLDFKGLFFPYLGERADPWARGRVGSSSIDAIMALASYCQLGLTAVFGVLAATSFRSSTLLMAIPIYFLTVPGYIFDRTRSYMLIALLPGFLAFIFIRLRTHLLVRVAVMAVGFLVLEGWMRYVIEFRGVGSIAAIFHARIKLEDDPNAGKQYGLNMFEELSFINNFIENGTYRPNWGQEYLSELVNPIPRSVWHEKPYIGIDYAVARGLSFDEAGSTDAGVGATISTGMIGQGIVNFGRILGPLASALLMSFWVASLARQDIRGRQYVWRLLLYALGLALTFNMGRDITLLVIYPYVFGYILVLIVEMGIPAPRRRIPVLPSATPFRSVPRRVTIRRHSRV